TVRVPTSGEPVRSAVTQAGTTSMALTTVTAWPAASSAATAGRPTTPPGARRSCPAKLRETYEMPHRRTTRTGSGDSHEGAVLNALGSLLGDLCPYWAPQA